MTPHGDTEQDVLALVEAICRRDGSLSRLAAGIVAALSMGIASDSRSFARIFGIAHALVLREISVMEQASDVLTILSRDPRTQRTRLSLSENGAAFIKEITDRS